MTFATADLCDRFADRVQVCDPLLKDFGGRSRFAGRVETVKCFEDNSLVRRALDEQGAGKVLVVDAGGSLRCAMLGDQLAELAHSNGWEGVVLYGCIRDSSAMAGMDLGVKALTTHPRKSVKQGVGERGVRVRFAGVDFEAGHFVYCDRDGVVVAPVSLA